MRRYNHRLRSCPARWRLIPGRHWHWGLFIVLPLAMLGGLLACTENFSGAEDALGDTAQRIEQTVLPPIVEESEAMLRNFVNLLPLFLEICATPIGELGDFESQLPELEQAQQQVGDGFTLNDVNGAWQAAWRDVVFGDQDGQLSVNTGVPSVDVSLTARFRTVAFASARAVPFALPASQLVDTGREPGAAVSCEAGAPEGYYVFQDNTTGLWTLAWCTQDSDVVFEGELSGTAFSRVSRKVSSTAAEEVDSVTVNSSSTILRFEETAMPQAAEGIRFFVRPGESITFELRIGRAGGELASITRQEFRIGAGEQLLPNELDPERFQLVTAVPIETREPPDFTRRRDFATFVWQDDTQDLCTQGDETLWRLRFHAETRAVFSGFVALGNDDDDVEPSLRVIRVGTCREGQFEFENDNERLNYECIVEEVADNGYDVCVSGARRLQFSPEVEGVRDPTRVWIGRDSERPPSLDPHSVLIDFEVEERQSGRNLMISNSRLALLSTTEEGNNVRLREDQESLEVLCQPLDEVPVHVRLIGNGEYATERFEGSRYEFEDLEFTDGLRTFEVSAQRLPDRGELTLRTRDGLDTAEITVPAAEIADINGRVTSTIDITLTLDTLQLEFLDRSVNLSLE